MTAQGNIYGINGPIIYLKGDSGFQMNEMVYVGTGRLVGEVIGLTSERTTIEVYEETTGLKPGEPVAGTGAPVSATLAPGILTSIFDGIERPLNAIQKESGCYIDRGIHADSLDTKKKWHAHMTVKKGDRRYPASRPLITGQRIVDTLFPLAKGGTAAIPGGFGTGKTMMQHQIAKWSDADIIIYIGCGERGNEMTQVLEEFSQLDDPRTGNPLMERTTLIANTSNMPVAAREASLYSGLTLAEYYRDMGYHVAIMADSTSRWAEALRELSGRLEEMPAEEGFPAYLASRLSQFYERAGMVQNLNGSEGSVSIIGAVSPQGGDFSEPVTQNTKRFVRCFWGLDKNLAYARHFPAIQWLTSYSEYLTDLSGWYETNVDKSFVEYRNRLVMLLNQESSLMEIVKLIGSDVLPDDQKLVLEIARVIRLGFLQQNAFHKDDTCVPLKKQFKMMEIILYLYEKCRALISMGMPVSVLKEEKIFERVIAIRYDVPNDRPDMFDGYKKQIDDFYNSVMERNA